MVRECKILRPECLAKRKETDSVLFADSLSCRKFGECGDNATMLLVLLCCVSCFTVVALREKMNCHLKKRPKPPLCSLCRPDLIDWKKVERMRVRERIDLAFHVMDREYGVTRLLDPEGKSNML